MEPEELDLRVCIRKRGKRGEVGGQDGGSGGKSKTFSWSCLQMESTPTASKQPEL